MPIVFSCPHCHHRLRTPASKAGHNARCPSCQKAIWVPYESTEDDAGPAPATSPVPPPAPPTPEENVEDEAEAVEAGWDDVEEADTFVDEVDSDQSTVEVFCDECGAENLSTARRCSACGARLFDSTRQKSPADSDVGEILNTSVQMYGQIFSWLMVVAVVQVCLFWLGVILVGGGAILAGIALRDERAIATTFLLASPLILVVMTSYWVGNSRLYLNAAKDGHVRLGDLFYVFGEGRHLLLRAMAVVFVWGLISLFGSLLCIIPGVLVAMFSWPLMRILVEEEPPEMEATRTFQFVRDNFINVLLVGLVVLGVNMTLQSIFFCMGIIPVVGMLLQFTAYLVTTTMFELFYSVAYLRLTGQPTFMDEGWNRR